MPLGLGIFLIWWVYKRLTPEDLEEIKRSLQEASYIYIIISIGFGILSHMSRAYRWKYTLEPLGMKPHFPNSFMAVMVGYIVNLAVPRLGEISRCTVMSQYEEKPFDKLFGTVIAERVADMIILLSLIAITVIMQFPIIGGLLEESGMMDKFRNPLPLIIVGLVLIGVGLLFLRLLKMSSHPFLIKIRGIIRGIFDGIKSILQMKKRWAFIGHTFFIWGMYLAMFWIATYALEGTTGVSAGGILAAFVLGGLSIVATNGGIGAYPLAVQQILILYAVNSNEALAFGWIMWLSQTFMVVVLGGLSFALLPVYNRKIAANELESISDQ